MVYNIYSIVLWIYTDGDPNWLLSIFNPFLFLILWFYLSVFSFFFFHFDCGFLVAGWPHSLGSMRIDDIINFILIKSLMPQWYESWKSFCYTNVCVSCLWIKLIAHQFEMVGRRQRHCWWWWWTESGGERCGEIPVCIFAALLSFDVNELGDSINYMTRIMFFFFL